MNIAEVLEILQKAERIGENQDTPEGVRYIQISDTLAKKMSRSIENYIKENG